MPTYQSAQSVENHDYSGASYSNSTPFSATAANAASSGAVVCVTVNYFFTTGGAAHGALGTLTDGTNIYTSSKIVPAGVDPDPEGQMFYAVNVTGSPTVYTFTPGVTSNQVRFINMFVDVFTGMSSAALDGAQGAIQISPGTGANAVASGTFTSSSNGDLVWGSTRCMTGPDTASAGTGYTQAINAGGNISEYKLSGSSGSNQTTFTVPDGTGTFLTFGMALTAPAVSGGIFLPPFIESWV